MGWDREFERAELRPFRGISLQNRAGVAGRSEIRIAGLAGSFETVWATTETTHPIGVKAAIAGFAVRAHFPMHSCSSCQDGHLPR